MAQISRIWGGTSIGDSGPYSAEQWRAMWAGWGINELEFNYDAVGYVPGSSLPKTTQPMLVAAQSVPNLSVFVFNGICWVFGAYYFHDGTTLGINSNLSGNDRIDTIVLEMNWAAQVVRLNVVEGAPAAVPVAPTLTQTLDVLWQHPIADVYVTNGASTITNANITNGRMKPIPFAQNQVKTAAFPAASSTFQGLWNTAGYQLANPLNAVQYDNTRSLFLSPDYSTTWYEVPRYTLRPYFFASSIINSGTQVNITAPITVTPNYDHVYAALTITGPGVGTTATNTRARITYNDGTTNYIFEDSYSTSLHARLPCVRNTPVTFTLSSTAPNVTMTAEGWIWY